MIFGLPVESMCPACLSAGVMNYGRRNGWQHYRCKSAECGCQFSDKPEAFGQRFPDTVIALSIRLHLAGMPFRKVAAEIEHRFSISDTRIAGSTVLDWVKEYVSLAAGDAGGLLGIVPFKSSEFLSVEFASLHPAESGCWVVQDLKTSYVLAAQASSVFDSGAAREVIEKFRASIRHLPEKVSYFTFGTDEEFGKSEDFLDVLEAIKRQFPSSEYIPPGEIPPEYSLILGPGGAFWGPLQTMRKRKAFRGPESRQRFFDGWSAMHNFFVGPDHGEAITPDQNEEFLRQVEFWRRVVNCRVILLYANKRRLDDFR
jgi:transposase-like protein